MAAVDVTDSSIPSAASPISLFLRSREKSKSMRVSPMPVTEDSSIKCQPIDALAEWSANGACLAVVEKDGVRVLNGDSGEQVFSIARPQVQAIALSPKGTYLLTWEKQREAEANVGNLRIWHVATGELTCHWHQKVLGEKAMWPAVRWSVDEEICYRLVTNTVHFFDGQKPSATPTHKLHAEGVAQCSIEPTGAPHHVATFVPQKGSTPATLRLWQYPDFGEGRFLTTRSFFKAESVNFLWNPRGGSLLVHTHTDADMTGKSYMGETGLYFMPLGEKKGTNVTLRKEGPIHDVQWSPLGDEFVVIFGTSPPEACIFNTKCEVIHSFGEMPRNTISWAPHGRFLVLAGFGNMSGELSFYDRKSLNCLGTVDAHMTVNYGWSADSRRFLTAILFPRLRVDNGYRIWSCAGGLLHEERIDELTVASWRPRTASDYPPPDEADIKAHPAASRGSAQPFKASKYVPPGARGGGGGGGRSLAELALQKGVEPGVGGGQSSGRSLSQLSKAMESGGSAALRVGGPIGAETADGASSSRNAAKNKAKKEAAKKKKEAEAAGTGVAAAAALPAASASTGGSGEGEDTEDKLTKKVRNVEKKLRQISELKELRAGGKPLEKNQLDKIEAEAAVNAELEELQQKLKQLGEKGKWR